MVEQLKNKTDYSTGDKKLFIAVWMHVILCLAAGNDTPGGMGLRRAGRMERNNYPNHRDGGYGRFAGATSKRFRRTFASTDELLKR